jgi:serine/threonine protein kinase
VIVPITEVVAIRNGRECFRKCLPPGEYVIGRESTCAIHLDASNVSRSHARLTLRYSDWMIEDLESSNGTFVSGERIEKATLLFPRQEVRVANIELKISRVVMTANLEDTLAPQTEAVVRFLPAELRGNERYKVIRLIAMGGMGAVLEVEDAALRRKVAMKVLLEVDSPEQIARFIEEAQVTSQLAHPNIIPIYDINVNERENPFFTMKLLEGVSLGSVLSQLRQNDSRILERYPLDELLRILGKVCDALSFAHACGVIHRDLKPDNVMLGSYGEVLVIDWGLAKSLGTTTVGSMLARQRMPVTSARADAGSEFATGDFGVVGTPHFMSPEQAIGEVKTIDCRTDVYALGAILYQVLTLKRPIEGGDTPELLEKVANGRLAPIQFCSNARNWRGILVCEQLAAVAVKALSRDKKSRHPTARDFQLAMRRAYLPAGGDPKSELITPVWTRAM